VPPEPSPSVSIAVSAVSIGLTAISINLAVSYKTIQARIKVELYLKIILDLIKACKVKDA
jgi:hypothetical protein